MVKIDNSQSNPDGGGGNGFDEKSNCHLVIESWEDHSAGENPHVEFSVVSVASDVPSQVGKKRKEKFYLAGRSVDKFLQLACATGVYNTEIWRKDIEAKRSPDIDCEAMIGRDFCSPIGMRPFDLEYNKKRQTECEKAGDHDGAKKIADSIEKNAGKSFAQLGGDKGFTFWAPGDPEADHVPLDPDTRDPHGDLPTKSGATRRRGSGPQNPPARSTTPHKPAPLAPQSNAQQSNIPASAADDLI